MIKEKSKQLKCILSRAIEKYKELIVRFGILPNIMLSLSYMDSPSLSYITITLILSLVSITNIFIDVTKILKNQSICHKE